MTSTHEFLFTNLSPRVKNIVDTSNSCEILGRFAQHRPTKPCHDGSCHNISLEAKCGRGVVGARAVVLMRRREDEIKSATAWCWPDRFVARSDRRPGLAGQQRLVANERRITASAASLSSAALRAAAAAAAAVLYKVAISFCDAAVSPGITASRRLRHARLTFFFTVASG